MLYQFSYDTAGNLANVTDSDGNVVTVERNSSGNATAIISSYGQRTNLTLDAGGYLAGVTDPANNTIWLAYTAGGLLINLTDTSGNTHNFSYDSDGRLIRDTDPAGGSKTLERTNMTNGYSVKLTTGMNRNTTYQVEELSTGEQKRTNTYPDGLAVERIISPDGSENNTYPDGSRITLINTPDPRFGMLAPLSDQIIAMPSGLTQTIINRRTVTLNNTGDIFSLNVLNETMSINGRNFTSSFNASTNRITGISPEGRISVSNIDNKNRIIESEIPGLIPVRYAYDVLGRLSAISEGQRVYSFSYDAQGNLANITDPLSRTVNFEYDLAGKVTRQTLQDRRQIQYTYDANGNVITITPPGRPAHLFTYDEVDLVKDYLPPDIGTGTNLTQYTYNIDKQLTRVLRPDGGEINLEF